MENPHRHVCDQALRLRLLAAMLAVGERVFWAGVPVKLRLTKSDGSRLCLLFAALLAVLAVQAQGIAGNRYFPGTLTFDDPAVADELILPNFSSTKPSLGNDDLVTDTTVAASFARLLTPDLAFGVIAAGRSGTVRAYRHKGDLELPASA